jgi:hypothetical protein
MHVTRYARSARAAVAFATAALAAGCAGGGSEGSVLVPAGSAGTGSVAGVGNTVVRIYVPAGATLPMRQLAPQLTPPPIGAVPGTLANPQAPATPPVSTPAPAPGSQSLAINVSGPTTFSQTVSVGPNSAGCTPAAGGSTCQLALSLPSGAYVGTVGSAGIAFTVSPGSNNALNLTLGGVPSQIAVVPASFTSAQTQAGVVDLYGAGKHPLLVEMLDANQNVMVGGTGTSFSLNQSGGSLSVSVAQGTAAPNLFYVTASSAPSGSFAILHVGANYGAPGNPCMQSGAVCTGTARIDVRQLLGVANSAANSVTLYVAGQSTPLATIQNGVTNPQALVFDGAGDLFVANQPGTVTEYAPPYNQAPVIIGGGINHPQSLAVDARGDIFVANGSGSNTVTIYAPPYTGGTVATIASNVNDPVSLALDSNADLFVVNAAASTVAEYTPPYAGTPTIISRGLNTPSSLALDSRGNLFVANLNSTPNSVVEYAPPFSDASAPVATITNGVNEQGSIALVSSNLFVPNQGANTVTEYAAPYTNSPTTIAGGQSQPLALAVDSAGNLYVANYGNNTVTFYSSPYAPGSWGTIANGINAPLALALSPATAGGPTLLP